MVIYSRLSNRTQSKTKNMKHKHADSIMAYAKDAQETETPWERWEFNDGEKWRSVGALGPSWKTYFEYRRIIPSDPYAELRAAHKAGKVIEMNMARNAELAVWGGCPDPKFDSPPELYRIKPAWTLDRSVNGFELKDGQEWHRTDWTKDMLPEGWRPLLLWEVECEQDEYYCEDEWHNPPCSSASGAREHDFHRRTRRPLPPLKKMVPLGADDLPPGSAIRQKGDTEWRAVIAVYSLVQVFNAAYTFGDLKEHYEINRNDGKGWVACEKEETK